MSMVSQEMVAPATESEEARGVEVDSVNNDSLPPLVDDNDSDPQGPPPSGGYHGNEGGVRENWEQEMQLFGTRGALVEPSVKCIAQDETTTAWQASKHAYSLPLSSSVTDLHSAFAKETGRDGGRERGKERGEGRMERVREGWRKRERDGEGGREGRRGEKEGWREGGREGAREGEREGEGRRGEKEGWRE